jgi:hypothetical protein
VEGSHFGLKTFIEGKNNDFLTCFNAFKRHGEHQHNEISVSIGIERGKTLQDVPEFLEELHGTITHFAIKKIKEQLDLLSHSDHRPCTGTFRTSWGLPCSHDIAREREVSKFLSLRHVHDQWRLVMDIAPESQGGLIAAARSNFKSILSLPEHSLRKIYEEVNLIKTGRYALVPILPPNVKLNNKGRPRTKNPATSKYGRWKSKHEVEETKKKRVNKCGLCSQRGHSRTTCPKRLEEIDSDDADDNLGPHLKNNNDDEKETSDEESEEHETSEDFDQEHELKEENDLPCIDLNENNKSIALLSVPKRIYKCRRCGIPGHRINTCKQDTQRVNEDLMSEDDHCDSHDPQAKIELKPDSVSDVSNSNLWSDLEDGKILCPFCDEEMPSAPSKKLLLMQSELLALPNVTKGIGRSGAMNLPVS